MPAQTYDKIIKISDIAKALQVSQHVIRRWEKENDIQVPRNNKGHRLYTVKDLETFRNIQNKVNSPNPEFHMARSSNLNIASVAKELNVSQHVIRRWEKENNLEIDRDAKGHRIYTRANVAKLRDIQNSVNSKETFVAKINKKKQDKINKLTTELNNWNKKALIGTAGTLAFLSILTLFVLPTIKISKPAEETVLSYNVEEDIKVEEASVLGERDRTPDFWYYINVPTNIGSEIVVEGDATFEGNIQTPGVNLLGTGTLSGLAAIDTVTQNTLQTQLSLGGDITGTLGDVTISEGVIDGTEFSDDITQEGDFEIDGNLNLTGEFQSDGDSGEDGQVLTSTGDGFEWQDIDAEDANTLDGIDSLQFLRSDVSDEFTSGTLSFASETFLDLYSIDHSTTAPQGLRLPQADYLYTPAEGEGYIAYETDENRILIYNGTNWVNISGASSSLQEGYQIGNEIALSAANGDLRIYNDDFTELLFLDESNGRVGIGTTAPNYKLDVNGTFGVSGASTLSGTTTLAGAANFNNTATFNSTVSLPSVTGGSDNTVLILNSSNQLATDEIDSRVWGTALLDDSDIGVTVQGYNANTSFLGQTISNAELVNSSITISAGTGLGGGGTVALGGTVAISSVLGNSIEGAEITNGTIEEVDLEVTNAPTDTYLLTYDNATGGFTWVDPTTVGGTIDGSGTSAYLTKWLDSDTIEASSIYETGGSIGIGTTNPTDELHVVGNIFATAGLHIGSDGTGTLIDDASNGTTSTTLYIGNESILASGDIGNTVQAYNANTSLIGQTIEGSEITDATVEEVDLEVTNAPTDNYLLTYDNATGGFTWIDPTTVGEVDGSGTANYIPIWTDTDTIASSLLYQTGGAIGIGTTAPSATLEVVGSGNFSSTLTAGGTVTFTGLSTGTDNSVLVLNSSNQLVTDEIDNRVWGTTLLDDTDIGVTVQAYNANTTILGNTIEKNELADSGTLSFDWDDSEIEDNLSLETISGTPVVSNGVRIGTDTTDYLIDDTSNGSGSATLYIGNESILASGDIGNSVQAYDANTSLLGQTISNAELENSSITVTAGTGLTGGGSVSLGGSVTLNNALGTAIEGSEITDGTIEEVDLEVTNTPTDNYLLTFDNATGGFTWIDPLTVGGVFGSGTTNYIPIWTDSDTLADSALYQTGGQVGIGTTAPSSLLTVAGTLDATGQVTFSGLSTGTDNSVIVLNSSNQLVTDEIDSRVWGSTLLDDTDIGVTVQGYNANTTTLGNTIETGEISDDNILEVDFDATNAPTAGYILSYDSGTGGFTWIANSGGTGASKWTDAGAYTYLTGTTDDIVLGGTSTTDAPFWFDVSTSDIVLGGANTGNGFETTIDVTDPTADRTIILPDVSGEISLLGQTISGPEITDNSIEETDLELTNSPTDNYILSYDSASGGFTWVNPSGTGIGSIDGSGTSNYLTMWSDADTLTDSSLYETGGQIGIGTTVPSALLTVAGTIDVTGAADFSGGLTNSSGEFLISGGNAQIDDDINLTLGTGDDVTINYTSGQDSFDITNTAQYFRIDNQSLTGLMYFLLGSDDANSKYSFQNNSEAVLLDIFGDGEVHLSPSGGPVGIGTTNPTTTLDIEGTLYASGAVSFPGLSTGTDNSVLIQTSGGEIATDEIDSRVWGTTLLDDTDIGVNVQAYNVNTSLLGQTIETGEITDDTILEADLDATNAPTDNYVLTFDNATSGFTWVDPTTVGAVSGSGTANYLTKWSGTDTLASSILYETGGQIGIGTTAPASILHLENAAPVLTATSTNGGSGFRLNVLGLDANSDLLFRVQDSGTNRLVLMRDGQFGLGDDDPDARLDIHSTDSNHLRLSYNDSNYVRMWSTSAGSFIAESGSGVHQFQGDEGSIIKIHDNNAGTNQATNVAIDFYRSNGTVEIGRLGPVTINDSDFYIKNSVAGGLRFQTNATDAMYLTSAGNLGIGTTNPSYALDVNGTAGFGSTIYAASIGADIDNSVVVLNSSGLLKTDEIDSRVWGTTLLDDTEIGVTVQGYNANTTTLGNTIEKNELANSGTLSFDWDDTEVADDLTLGTISGTPIVTNGLSIGTDTTNYLIDDASNGAGSATLYIGNESILASGDIGVTVQGYDANTSLLGQTISNAELENSSVTITAGTGLTGGGAVSLGATVELQSALGTSIETGEITDDEILEVDLDVTNTPTDEYLLSFDNVTGGFTWVNPSAVGSIDGSGTGNYITKWTDPNTLTDSGIYETGGNLGIGTTAPAAKLAIGASSEFTVDSNGNLTKVNNVAYSWPAAQAGSSNMMLVNDSSGNLSWESLADVGGFDGSGTTNYIPYFSDSDSLQTSNMYYDGTNIGIGTTAPSAKLEVQKTTEQMRLSYDDSNYAAFTVSSSGVLTIDPSHTNNSILFGNGTLGIIGNSTPQINAVNANIILQNATFNGTAGTTDSLSLNTYFSPSSGTMNLNAFNIKPTINQSGTATGDFTAFKINPTNTNFLGTNLRLMDVGIDGSSLFVVNDSGNVFLNGLNTGTDNSVLVLNSSNEVVLDEIDPDVWTPGTLADISTGTANYLPIWSDADSLGISSLYETGGFIGIGTTAPSRALHVNSGTTNNISILESTDDLATVRINDDNTFAYLSAKDGYFSVGGTAGLTSDGININTTTGYVGVGTTAPAEALEVVGNIFGNGNFYLGATTETLANTGFTMDGDDLFVAGMAGIEGNVYTDGSFIAGASTTYGNGSITQSSGETLTMGTTSADLTVQTTTSGDIILNPADYVGIGTTAPTSLLTVAGTTTSTTGDYISGVADGATAIAYDFDTTNALSTVGAKLLSISNNGTEKMYLDKDGNLYVSGTITAGNGNSMLLTNKSGGDVANRSIVILDESNNSSFTTTTTAYSTGGIGVVVGVGLGVANDADGDGVCDANDKCMVAYAGEVEVTTKNAASATKGDYLYTSDTAGSAGFSAKLSDGLAGVVSDTTNAASGYVKMIFKAQPQVTAAASIDKLSKHNEYWLYANDYDKANEAFGVDYNLLARGIFFDTFSDSLKTDSANTTVSQAEGMVGLIGGQTTSSSTTDNAGNTYLASNTVNAQFLYDRERDSSPEVMVELGKDPYWYKGVSLGTIGAGATYPSTEILSPSGTIPFDTNPNLSTYYNGSLIKATGRYTSNARGIYITIKSPTTFDWTDYNGNSATGVTITPSIAQTLGSTGVSVTFTNTKYNVGDVFKIHSWYVEPESSTRGELQEFPEKSYLVAVSSGLSIIDAETQKVWMKFTNGANKYLWITGSTSAVEALNGSMHVGSSTTGTFYVNFNTDTGGQYHTNRKYYWNEGISERNSTITYTEGPTSLNLVNVNVNDVSMAVIPNQPTQEVTVSGWGYIQGVASDTMSENVNLPYNFNDIPNIRVTNAGKSESGVPSDLADCTDGTLGGGFEWGSIDVTTSAFVAGTGYDDSSNFNTSHYYCYTWEAKGTVAPKQYVAVGTDGGVTVISETDETAIDMTVSGDTLISRGVKLLDSPANKLYILGESVSSNANHLNAYSAVPYTDIYFNDNTYRTRQFWWADVSFPNIYMSANTVDMNVLEVVKKDNYTNTVYVGNDEGLTRIEDNYNGGTGNDSNQATGTWSNHISSAKYYTPDFVSEEMVGDIRGMWPLNGNNTASDFEDVSVNDPVNLTGTNITSADAVSGVRGEAYDFDGSTEYLACTDAACGGSGGLDIVDGESVSFGAWIKSTDAGGAIIGKKLNENAANAGYSLKIGNNKLDIDVSDGTTQHSLEIGPDINNDEWHHVVAVYDDSQNLVLGYVDGNLVGTDSQVDLGSLDNTISFNIGTSNDGATSFYAGYIDEAFVTASVLSANQVKKMYETGYRALQSHGTGLGSGAADNNQRLAGTSPVIGSVAIDENNQYMYVGTNNTTTGALTKIQLNSDTNIKTYTSSSNTPAGGATILDEDVTSLLVSDHLETVGSAASGIKTMGIDNYATATSGNFVSKTFTASESFDQAYVWAQVAFDSDDSSNTLQTWASNDGGSNYYQCNYIDVDNNADPEEYEYFCQFNTTGDDLKIKFVMARGSTKTNTFITKYGAAWIDSNAVAQAAGAGGFYSTSNSSLATGSYLELAHNQATNDIVTDAWIYDQSTWKKLDSDYTPAYASEEKNLAHNEYLALAANYNQSTNVNQYNDNANYKGIFVETFEDGSKLSGTTTVMLDTYKGDNVDSTAYPQSIQKGRAGLVGGVTYNSTNTDTEGNAYLGSDDANDVYYYDRTQSGLQGQDSTPETLVDLGIDPNWANGVTLENDPNFTNSSSPTGNLSTSYNGSLLSVSGRYATGEEDGPIIVEIVSDNEPTASTPTVTFNWATGYTGTSEEHYGTGVTATKGTAYTLETGTNDIQVTFADAEYHVGDRFQIASWYLEPETGNDRGVRQEFPERSYVITQDGVVTIIDADTNKLWMKVTSTGWKDAGTNAATEIVNGVYYEADASGVRRLDFNNDSDSYYYYTQGLSESDVDNTIASRHVAGTTLNLINPDTDILGSGVSPNILNLSVATIPNQPTGEITVDGWGYIEGAAATQIQENVELPYEFNNVPNVIISANGEVSTGSAPTDLGDCLDNSQETNAVTEGISTTGFSARLGSTAGTNLSNNYYCYTWQATGIVKPQTFIAVGTNQGVSVINESAQTAVDISRSGSDDSSSLVKLVDGESGRIYIQETVTASGDDYIHVFRQIPTSDITINDNTYRMYQIEPGRDHASVVGIVGANLEDITSLEVTEGTSTIDGKSNTVYIGTDAGMSIVQEYYDSATPGDSQTIVKDNTSVKNYTKDYISEEMIGDIRGMWPLNGNNTASDFEDVSVKGNDLTGTNITSADAVSGVRGEAYDFDGSTEYLSRASDSDFDMSTTLTYGAWIKTSTNAYGHIIRRAGNYEGTSTNAEYNLSVNTDGTIYSGWRDNTDGAGQTFYSNKVVTDNNWHHVISQRDGNTVRIYIDGRLDNSVTLTENGTYTFDDTIFIGGRPGAAYFTGTIDEPFITHEVISRDQIKRMYESGKRALEGSHGTNDYKNNLDEAGTGYGAINDIADVTVQQTPVIGGGLKPTYAWVAMEDGDGDGDGYVNKIDLASDTIVQTMTTTTDPSIPDNDATSLAVSYSGLEVVGMDGVGARVPGLTAEGNDTSGSYVSETTVLSENIASATLWVTGYVDSEDSGSSLTVKASNDAGSTYSTCHLINTYSEGSLPEYEYGCDFSTSDNDLVVKVDFARTDADANVYVTQLGASWLGQSGFRLEQADNNTVRLYNYSGTAQNLRVDAVTNSLGTSTGNVSLAPLSADVDTLNNSNSIWINKTGTGGNLLKLQVSASDILTLSSTGTMTLTGDFVPGADDTYDLGSTSARWQDLYLGPATLHIGTSATDEGTLSYDTTNNILNFSTDSTSNGDIAFFGDDLYIDKSTGAIGIGTTAPASALDIVGSNTNGLTIRGADTSNEVAKMYMSAAGSFIMDLKDSNDGNTFFDLRPESSNFGLVLRETDGTGTAIYSNFSVIDSTADYLNMTVNTNDNTAGLVLTENGNVGIGTTNPGEPLDVYSATGDFLANFESGDTRAAIKIKDTSSTFNIVNQDSTLSLGITNVPSTQTLNIQNNEVGVGVVDPLYRFHVYDATNSDYAAYINNAGGDGYGLHIQTGASNEALPLLSLSDSTTERLRVNANGQVGIGTTAPSAKLELHNTDDTNVEPFRIYNDNGNIAFDFTLNGTGGGLFAINNSAGTRHTQFYADGNSYINTGNLGIGTTDPQGKLHVMTNSTGGSPNTSADDLVIENGSANAGLSILTANTGIGSIYFADPDTTSVGRITYDHSDNSMKFYTNNGERMHIDSTGNVGISATPSASYDLKVGGSAIINDSEYAGNRIEVNKYGTGNRYAYIDFVGDDTYTDYGFRIIRANAGANSDTSLLNRGTGNLRMIAESGGVQLTTGASSWSAISDIRLKENITPVENVLDKIRNIDLVRFNIIGSDATEIGLIAQNVQENFPEIVFEDQEGNLSLAYDRIGPIALQAVQEQQEQIDTINQLLGLDTVEEATESTSSASLAGLGGMVEEITSVYNEFKAFVEALGLSKETDAEGNDVLAVASDMTVTGSTTLSDVQITGDLTAGLINVDTIENSVNVLGASCVNETTEAHNAELCEAQALKLQSGLAGNLDVFDGKIVLEPDGTINTETIVASEYKLSNDTKTAGTGTLVAGETEIMVATTAVEEGSKILVTPRSNTKNNVLYVETVTAGESFVIQINTEIDTDIEFDWWIVNIE